MRKPDPEHIRKDLQKLHRDSLALNREVVDKMSSLATAAFGLVAALAWNNAIQAIFARFYKPDDPNAIWPLLGYAAIVTVIGVLAIVLIGRSAGRLKKRVEEAQAKIDGRSPSP